MSVRCLISEQKLDCIREIVNKRDPKEDYKLIRSIGVGTYGEVYKVIYLTFFNVQGAAVGYKGLCCRKNNKSRCKR